MVAHANSPAIEVTKTAVIAVTSLAMNSGDPLLAIGA